MLCSRTLKCQDPRRSITEPPTTGNVRRVSEPLSAYMTTRDIAAYLGVKPSTVTAYVARGQFPPADAVVGATKLWRRATVQSWAAQRPRKGSPRPDQTMTRRSRNR